MSGKLSSEITIYPPTMGQVIGGSKSKLGELIESGQLPPESAFGLTRLNIEDGQVVDWSNLQNIMMALTAIDSKSNASKFESNQVNSCLHSLVAALESMDPSQIRQHIRDFPSMIHRPDIIIDLSDEILLQVAYLETGSVDSFFDDQYIDERYPV